jgi:hypothetical protein
LRVNECVDFICFWVVVRVVVSRNVPAQERGIVSQHPEKEVNVFNIIFL